MNKYEILQTIGQGQYGVVLKARNKQNDQLVAIKKFKQDDNDEENKKVILREVKVLKMMHHQNITQLKQAFRKKGKVFIVCQYVQKNLLQIIQENKTIEPQKIKIFMTQLLKGIQYMHSIDLIHRDLKPQNLLINSDNTLKICDFGFARAVPTSGKMTDYVATRWYRSPELLLSRDDYDKSVDIWAIGCIFSQMIDSQPLFPGQSEIDQLYLMQRCLGPLCPDHQQYFLKNPKFVGMKFPEFNNMESLDRRYLGKIDKDGLDLLKKMLKMNPKQRITASEALRHPYFTRIKTLDKFSNNFHQKSNNIESNVKVVSQQAEQLYRANKQQKIGLNNKVTGINKIKVLNNQQTKSKIIQNIQNKVSLNPNNITQNKDTKTILNQDRLIRKQQFQYILQKKTKSPQGQNEKKPYPPDFEEQQRVETPILKSRQNYRKRKKFIYPQQQQQLNNYEQSSKTPILTKMLVKKKVSKVTTNNEQDVQKKKKLLRDQINSKLPDKQKQSMKTDKFQSYNNEVFEDFEYIGLNNFKRKDHDIGYQHINNGNYNIIFNHNTFNYNYGTKK